MATAQTVSFWLEEKTVKAIESAVASGKYANADEFVTKAVESFQPDEFFMDDATWQKAEEVAARMKANPSLGSSVEEVMERLGLHENDEEEETHRAA